MITNFKLLTNSGLFEIDIMRVIALPAAIVFALQCFVSVVTASEFPAVAITTVKSDLSKPWAMTQLPDDAWLITEMSGAILKLNPDGKSLQIGEAPDSLLVAGQGGLLDIVQHPQFTQNRWVYISYAQGSSSANQLTIARAKLVNDALSPWEVLFSVFPAKDTPVHYAGRLQFLTDNSLLLTSGDGFDYREDAQKKSSLLGKVVRISDDGHAMPDNPFFIGDGKAQDYIFTLGHRNAQGLVYDESSQSIILHEHGPAGGDEINFLNAGDNYGWPVVTEGKDYSGASITPFTDYPGMRLPAFNWTPSIAPSAMAIIDGELFPALRGDLLVTALKTKRLYWLQLTDQKVISAVPVVEALTDRLREIHIGNDGAVYLLTDGEGASLLKMTPIN